MQKRLEFPFLRHRKPYLMAHRGNKVNCPENTMAAFRAALDECADIIETDLHITVDGEIVCIHDATVDRTTNGTGAVNQMTLKTLKALSASYGRETFAQERVPTLSELAAILPEHVAIALELKSDAFLDKKALQDLIDVLNATCVRNRTIVLSFSWARLMAVREYAPDLPLGWITLSSPRPPRGVQFLGPAWPILIRNPLYVLWAHRQGQLVCPLDPAPDKRLLYYRLLSCDAVLSDDPGSTNRALRRKERIPKP